jgi:hypothetical protein
VVNQASQSCSNFEISAVVGASVVTQLLKMPFYADPTDLSHPLDPRRFVAVSFM